MKGIFIILKWLSRGGVLERVWHLRQELSCVFFFTISARLSLKSNFYNVVSNTILRLLFSIPSCLCERNFCWTKKCEPSF